MDGPEESPKASGGVAPRRWPFGASAVVAALVTAAPVVLFDQAEGLVDDAFGIEGGPDVLLLIVLGFAFGWLLAAALLARFSPAPAREGVLAGCGIAALMAFILIGISVVLADLSVVVYVLPLFGSLAVGFGAVAGMLAQRWQGRDLDRRTAPVLAVACGALLLLSTMVPFPVARDPGSSAGVAAWILVLLFLGAGALGLWATRGKRLEPALR